MASKQPKLLIRLRLHDGVNEIVGSDSDLMEYLRFGVIRLREGEEQRIGVKEEEAALVVLTGTATVKVDRMKYEGIGGRLDVFSGNAATVYLPCHHEATIACAGAGPLAVAVCRAPSTLRRAPALIRPEDVRIKTVGRANWRRTVRDIIDYTFEAQHLVLGETVNPPGNWSSSPPHKHEVDNPPEEVKMEEIYFFQIKPEQGFGFQRIYTDDRSIDVSYAVQHNDTVLLPKGYHPVAAAPGYQLYYLWFMAGPTSRVLRPKDDPAHTWLKWVEPVVDGLR